MGNFGQFGIAANASAAMQLAGIELVEETSQLKLSLGQLKTPGTKGSLPLEVACATRILCKAGGGGGKEAQRQPMQIANSPVINRNLFAPNRTPVRSDSGSYIYCGSYI